MKRKAIHVILLSAEGDLLHQETRQAFNAGVRASEDAMRSLARTRGEAYRGDIPKREGGVYSRRWTGDRSRLVITALVRAGE